MIEPGAFAMVLFRRKRRLSQLRAHCNATGNVTRRLRAAEALEMRGGWAW